MREVFRWRDRQQDNDRKGLTMATAEYDRFIEYCYDLIYEWERDFDGGASAHANAEDLAAIRDYLTRNGFTEVYTEDGRTTFDMREW